MLAQSGSFVTSGSGLPATDDGLIAIVLSAIFGAMCGVMGGFVVSYFCRYVGYLFGRYVAGGRCVLIGALLGAAILGVKAWFDTRD